jgi:hypothetical protein
MGIGAPPLLFASMKIGFSWLDSSMSAIEIFELKHFLDTPINNLNE